MVSRVTNSTEIRKCTVWDAIYSVAKKEEKKNDRKTSIRNKKCKGLIYSGNSRTEIDLKSTEINEVIHSSFISDSMILYNFTYDFIWWLHMCLLERFLLILNEFQSDSKESQRIYSNFGWLKLISQWFNAISKRFCIISMQLLFFCLIWWGANLLGKSLLQKSIRNLYRNQTKSLRFSVIVPNRVESLEINNSPSLKKQKVYDNDFVWFIFDWIWTSSIVLNRRKVRYKKKLTQVIGVMEW